jgi:hypothetical protein
VHQWAELQALTPTHRLDLTFSGPWLTLDLTGTVGQILPSPHPVGRIIGHVRPIAVVDIVDDRAGACGRSLGMVREREVPWVWRTYRQGDVPPGREIGAAI